MSGQFAVIDHDNDNRRTFDTRSDAEDAAETVRELGSSDVEVVAPGDGDEQSTEADGGPAVVDDAPDTNHEPEVLSPEEIDDAADQLPDERHVDEDPLEELGDSLETDPLSILPGHMVDNIQGKHAVNKRGYAMIAERYGIEASAEIVELPWENDEGRCVARATATTEEGKEYSGWATACADDGDMPEQLIELAETRALKRSVSWASGVGIVSYQELSSKLE